MKNEITLNERHIKTVKEANAYSERHSPYPRVMVDPLGHILLATSKERHLTTGILIGKTKECKNQWPLGSKFTDWEVFGELTDYDKPVEMVVRNAPASTINAKSIKF